MLGDIVTAVINGSDGCVLSFGHAKLGKTWTMVGSSTCSGNSGSSGSGEGGASSWEAGLMPTAIAWLFRGIAEQKTKTGARFSVRVSAVEIAGATELLRDLLAPHATGNWRHSITIVIIQMTVIIMTIMTFTIILLQLRLILLRLSFIPLS